ncbi:hypothetical protein SETIT_8G172200v2 [Setaria italica]|uniref:Protein kinase domain-containing protein n=1 Tax=Setaria italica TaxID=4555 RepID=A0A368S8Z3_SETIT|nr:hypothetical protein SETIT_8G172200v2 [Setaria italica]
MGAARGPQRARSGPTGTGGWRWWAKRGPFSVSIAPHKQERHIAMDHSSSGSPRKISFHLLQEITDCFSDERKLGSGGFGKVYMVRLSKKK